MAETTVGTPNEKSTREANIQYWRAHLKEAGSNSVLAYLLRTNEAEKAELAESGEDIFGSAFGLPTCVTLHLAARRDVNDMLARHRQEHFEKAILELPTVILAAAINEYALRFYLHHVLVEIFGCCDELDRMLDYLIEIWNRQREMPIATDKHYFETWWDDLAPPASDAIEE